MGSNIFNSFGTFHFFTTYGPLSIPEILCFLIKKPGAFLIILFYTAQHFGNLTKSHCWEVRDVICSKIVFWWVQNNLPSRSIWKSRKWAILTTLWNPEIFKVESWYFRKIIFSFSVNSWHYIRLSAHGSWQRGAGPAPVARRSAEPGRPLSAMSHEPRAKYNAKN